MIVSLMFVGALTGIVLLVTQVHGSCLEENDFRNIERYARTGAPKDDSVIYKNKNKFEGDVELGKHPISQYQMHDCPDESLCNAIRSPLRIWPEGIVPYDLVSSYSKADKATIAAAFDHIQKKTCIKFKGRSDERNYIRIGKDGGCWSNVGRMGDGAQTVSLDRGCVYVGVIVHELMHVLGFFHEQSRHDRDQYVTIEWDNIMDDAKDQFDKYDLQIISPLGTEYDYGSIMHYGPYAFTKRGRQTIVPKDRTAQIGQREGLSENDAFKINELYECDAPTTPKPDEPDEPEKPKPEPEKPEPSEERPTSSTDKPDTQKFITYKCYKDLSVCSRSYFDEEAKCKLRMFRRSSHFEYGSLCPSTCGRSSTCKMRAARGYCTSVRHIRFMKLKCQCACVDHLLG